MENLYFFINGNIDISEYGDEDKTVSYFMRFLTESKNLTKVKIVIMDELENEVHNEESINGLTLIKIDVTKFVETFNWENKLYIKTSYIVLDEENKELFKGSFPIINPEHNESLNMVCISDNMDINNKQEVFNNMCKDMIKSNPDIAIFMGGLVDAGHIFSNKIGFQYQDNYDTEEIYDAYCDLYRSTYGNKYLGKLMRNCLNIVALGEHDILPKLDQYNIMNSGIINYYYKEGMKAFIDYQYRLCNEVDENFYKKVLSKTLKDDISIYYSTKIGRYTFVIMDQINEKYHRGEYISDWQIEFIKDRLIDNHNILVSPKPLGYLNKKSAHIKGLFRKSGKTELLHPDNIEQTLKLLYFINKRFSKGNVDSDSNNDYQNFILAGSVRETYIQDILNNNGKYDEVVCKQLVSSGITGKTRHYDNVFKKVGNKFIHTINKRKLDNFKFGKKVNRSFENSFGQIKDDNISNHPITTYKKYFCI